MRKILVVGSLFTSGLLPSVACGGSSAAEVTVASEAAAEGSPQPPPLVPALPPPPCADHNPLKNAYFGDLHAHTSYSGDAYAFDTRNTPLDAYAFARGKALQIAGGADGGGPITKIDRPLDFLAVTDHAEFLAVAYGCGNDTSGVPYDPTRAIYDTRQCRNFREGGELGQWLAMLGVLGNVCGDSATCEPLLTSVWQKEQAAAAAAYERCRFTSFVGYEWSKTAGRATLHKNVIFASAAVPPKPFDSIAYGTQEQLWSALASSCIPGAGCDALTIPHNSNLSQGLAFPVPSAAEDLARMSRYEKLVEIFQHKGASECLSEGDPECTFELLPDHSDPVRDKPGYVREGLKKGLALRAASGGNPLTMGFVGATDTHNGTPGNVRESTFPGHAGSLDAQPRDRIKGIAEWRDFNPGGLTGVWAEENTRESLFAAMSRRETFATSGPRILVRFYETTADGDLCVDPMFPRRLVEGGAVAMGGSFQAAAPRFVVRAWKDATSLARIDIVKAWVDGGAVKEKVVERLLDASQASSACLTWTDEEATPGPAFYYARVLEVPSPRWSTYDCERAPLAAPMACAPNGDLRRTLQERAWSSPIRRLP